MKKSVVLLFSCLALVLSGSLLAQPEAAGQTSGEEIMSESVRPLNPGKSGRVHRRQVATSFTGQVLGHQKELELSEKQITDIRNVESELRKDIIKFRADQKIKRLELSELLQQAEINFEQVRAKQKEITALDEKISQRRIDAWEKIYNILSPEQKSKLKEIKQKK